MNDYLTIAALAKMAKSSGKTVFRTLRYRASNLAPETSSTFRARRAKWIGRWRIAYYYWHDDGIYHILDISPRKIYHLQAVLGLSKPDKRKEYFTFKNYRSCIIEIAKGKR